ncbi:MAG TPA: M4 family metallopeptidase, partial [Solirubrobacterales bacterium]|nr:M4 family metallopeptidase [Solirubrobacterales bacterium]
RDSWDGNGAPVRSTVHFREPSGEAFANAYWDGGNEQMVFGDGFAKALDVVGHEYTHAVTEGTSELLPSGQSGALNESFSDIVGEVIEWKKLSEESEEVDWKMGTELWEGPFRSLIEPNDYSGLEGTEVSQPDPKHLEEWIVTCLDSFGIHANSTITSHAFYLAVQELEAKAEMNPIETLLMFIAGWTDYLKGVPSPTLEDARAATIQAAVAYFGKESVQVEVIEDVFDQVGLDGTAQPTLEDCVHGCAFQGALYKHQGVDSGEAVEMLSTLYKARGELAMTSVAGDYFLPLYEDHMERITELVTQDPVLAEMTVAGLEEITPALEALIEGKGEKFELSSEQMEKIEAALRRLAEDDRIYAGENAGELADLIEAELQWMSLPSYGGMNYESGFERLNDEVGAQMMMLESGELIEPNCTGQPYSNNFHVNGFYAETPGHDIPGQVSPLEAGGIICGTLLEESPGKSGCGGEESLNTEVSVQLAPGAKVNSSKNLPSKSWVGRVVGRAFACAGNETQLIYGEAGLLSLSSWSEWQCPTAAVACYEGKSTFENGEGSVTGKGYAWVTEEEGTLTLTTQPVTVSTENGYFAQVGFGQFRVELCARAGSSMTKSCGGPAAAWIHQNGETADLGCPAGKGRYSMRAKNAAELTTVPVSACVRWTDEARMQPVDAPNSLDAANCIPATTTCVATGSKGNAFYSTNVSPSAASTWNSWSGPGSSPGHDIACPSSTVCVLAAGSVSGGGGNVYRASSLGGAFSSSFSPANGVGAISCPTTTFCVSAQEGGGFIRWTAKPSGTLWSAVAIGTGAMKDVACLSSSFCAVVDGAGNVRVATTEKGVKEAGGWTATNVNGAPALHAVACSSTSSCLAVDGTNGKVIALAIAGGGGATATSQTLAGAGKLKDGT